MTALDSGAAGLVRNATLFDIYEPKGAGAGFDEGERSLAIRLELRDDNTTLTDEQIERVVAGVVAALERGVGARLRK